MSSERWIVFNWFQLSKRYNIVLYYAPPGKEVQVGDKQQHIAWKVLTIPQGDGSICFPYNSRYGVGRAKPTNNKVYCINWTELERGKSIDLRPPAHPENPNSYHTWEKSSVRSIDKPAMQVRNGTDEPQNLVLGTVRTVGSNYISLFESSFIWRDVPPKNGIFIEFDPTLCAVLCDHSKESEIISTPIAPEQVIWRENISKLADVTYLELAEIYEGEFTIRKTE
ncbi:hypothetical protein BC629DRAFT_1012392 [Irpex lacteus]|nr:hypothetical protein BC629DRAFT_1012392 [Irpex lacteus]